MAANEKKERKKDVLSIVKLSKKNVKKGISLEVGSIQKNTV